MISAIIVIKNNPPHVFETINSINSFVDEIIIGDIGITATLKEQLEKNKKIKIVSFSEEVPYVELIREKLKQKAAGQYLLIMDPDELFPADIIPTLKKEMSAFDYFLIPRKNLIFGKWIEHTGWWPDYQVRFFKKESVIWPKILHTQPETTGKEYIFEAKEKNAIMHHNYENIDEYFLKAVRYAKSQAQEILEKKEEYSIVVAVQKSISEFITRFFASEGYKDGMHGFALSIMQMFYYLLVYFYYWEAKKYESVSQAEILTASRSFFKQGLFEVNHWLTQNNLVSQFEKIKYKIKNKFLS